MNMGDGPPTRTNIEDGFRWLVEGARAGDALFLYFSGHGGREECAAKGGFGLQLCTVFGAGLVSLVCL